MKKYAVITLVVAIVATLLLGIAGQVSAKAARYEVSSYEYVCLTDWGTVWEEGNVMHIRGIRHTNVNVSDDPELNGINTTVAGADINLKTGSASIRGTMSFQPEGINGTWEGSWTFISNKGVNYGRAVAHGTGALMGKTLFLDLYDAEPDPATQTICESIGEPHGNTLVKGYVLETGVQ